MSKNFPCPSCGASSCVIDSRAAKLATGKATVRRRRECSGCRARWTTIEIVPQTEIEIDRRLSTATGGIDAALEVLNVTKAQIK